MIDAFVKRSRVTLLIFVLVIILGMNSYNKIPKESTPDVKVPIIYTIAVLEGISPQDSERLLLRPLENSLKSVDGIKEMSGYANEGSAVVLLEFHAGFDSKKALDDVRNKVSEAESLLPTDVKKPTVHEVNLSLFPVLNIILKGNLPERTLISIARDLSTQIESLPGILQANIGGDREDSLEIIITPEALEAHGLSVSDIQRVVGSNNRLIAAGAITSKSGEFSIKIPSLVENRDVLLGFPVKVHNGAVLTLGDIADVRRTYKDPTIIARVNGKNAVVLEVSKRTGENIINTVNRIKDVVNQNSKYFPENLEIVYSGDQSQEIIDMVVDLENNIIIAVLLVMFVVVIAVGFRSAMLISLSIPFSFLAGVLFLYMFGYTMNLVVLFSLILTVGMIVDDAIVVSEYADRLMQHGIPLKKAFIYSAKRMLWPIITSTLVKIIVFLPLLFWPGVVGQFMKYMPITAIAILTNSLIFALFFQPTLGPLMGIANHHKGKSKGEDAEALDHIDLTTLDPFTNSYYVLLQKVLSIPKIFVGFIVGGIIVVYGFFIMFGAGFEFFPKVEPESVNISIIAPGNLSVYERNDIMKQIEDKLLPLKNEVKVFYVKAGMFDNQMNVAQDTIGSVFIEYENWRYRRPSQQIMNDAKTLLQDIKGIDVQILENRGGPPPDKPIQFDISDHDLQKAGEFADKILAKIREDSMFTAIEESRSRGSIEWHIIPNREEAAKYGVSLPDIGNTVLLTSTGMKVSTYRPDDAIDEVDIMVRFPQEYRSIQYLDKLKVITNSGAVPISYFVQKVPKPKVSKIKKVNKKSVISVKADVIPGALVDTQVSKIKKWVQEMKQDHQDVQIRFKGEDQDQQETGTFLKTAFLLALVLMFIVMLCQFNNYYHTAVVMSAVFLSTVGVILGLIITWQPFGIVMCGVGIIALAGIVLNNNILFIDTYQHLRSHGTGIEESIIRAGVQRLRPILLTAVTAVLGLMPMVLGITINIIERDLMYNSPASQWWRQLSASIAGGLTFATILTLFFTPCLLLLGKRFDPD